MPKPPPTAQPLPVTPFVLLGLVALPVIGAIYVSTRNGLPTLPASITAALTSAAVAIPTAAVIIGRAPTFLTTRPRFWAWHPDRVLLSVATATSAILTAVSLIVTMRAPVPLSEFYSRPGWAVPILALGITTAGWAFLAARLRLRRLARDRLLPDETLTARVVSAIRAAEAIDATRSVGVALDTSRARPIVTDDSLTAPHRVGDHYAYGRINRERLQTRDQYRILNGWTDPRDNWIVLPDRAGAMRALVIAASGSGKTYLLFAQMLCATAAQWPALFIDLKGDPEDADRLVDNARARCPRSRAHLLEGGFRFFDTPSVANLRDRILALFPAAQGADRYYEQRRTQILDLVLDDDLALAPTSLDDIERLFHTPDLLPDAERARRALSNPTKNGGTDGQEVLNEVTNAIRSIRGHITTSTRAHDGWSFATLTADRSLGSLRLYPATNKIDQTFAGVLLVALRQHMEHRMRTKEKDTPFLCVVDEFPQMISATDDAATTGAMLYETARSANIGLILAGQTISGFSNDPNTQDRLLRNGTAVIVGRTPDPEPVVELAGTTMHLESSADPEGGLKSSRAQHTYRIHPDDVRRVEIGGFWIIADGTTRRFNALP
ncbi:hypothetical protein AAFP30_27890 [Gordonia sp. CPCC 205515]|uniref:hypothetical protein n=1 Tax=Gordonia sp. CPCC 205515 TaxID=3140791 RepID=UPI003AF36D34